MTNEAPERVTFSIPPDADLSAEDVENLVESGEYESRSEAIRDALLSALDDPVK